MPDKVWKAFERTVASFFNSTRNALSGGNSKVTRSDSLHDALFIECKYRSRDSLYSLFDSVRERARVESKLPVICTKKKSSEGFLITVHSGDLDEFINRYLQGRSQSNSTDSQSVEQMPRLRTLREEN